MRGEKEKGEKGEDAQTLVSKDLKRKQTAITHKIQLNPTLVLAFSFKTDPRGYKTSLQLTRKTPSWRSTIGFCPETNKVDFTVSKRVNSHQIEVRLTPNSVEVGYTKYFPNASWMTLGAQTNGSGEVSPMLKIGHLIGGHKLSLACGYAKDHVDYMVAYSKGQTHIRVPFRVPGERWEGLILSVFLMSCSYLLAQAFPKDNKERSQRTRGDSKPIFSMKIQKALVGPELDVKSEAGQNLRQVLELLIVEKMKEISFDSLACSLHFDKTAVLRVDFSLRELDYCAIYASGDVLRFE